MDLFITQMFLGVELLLYITYHCFDVCGPFIVAPLRTIKLFKYVDPKLSLFVNVNLLP